jgi:hypothetical protein
VQNKVRRHSSSPVAGSLECELASRRNVPTEGPVPVSRGSASVPEPEPVSRIDESGDKGGSIVVGGDSRTRGVRDPGWERWSGERPDE